MIFFFDQYRDKINENHYKLKRNRLLSNIVKKGAYEQNQRGCLNTI